MMDAGFPSLTRRAMNPIAYKAHPLLIKCLALLTQPGDLNRGDMITLLALLILGSIPYAFALRWLIGKSEGFRHSLIRSFLLAVPANLLYTPVMLTLIGDIVHHRFLIEDRWFLLFTLLVISQLLCALYAFGIRRPEEQGPIGVESGLGISLLLLLVSMALSLALTLIELEALLF